MTEAQKYRRKKNILIAVFMILLVVFVCVICAILIYAKNHPKETYLSPDDIVVKQMQVADYVSTVDRQYTVISESNTFKVYDNGEELDLVLTDTKEIKLLRNDVEETINIMQNDTNINNNIKIIYQSGDTSLILTETGELYKLIDTGIVDGQLKVGQILTNMQVKDLVHLGILTESVYVINSEDKIINTDNMKEYSGIIKEIQTATSVIYVYEDYSFGLEEGKMFVDDYNNPINIMISFDNKIISSSNVIYEINTVENSLYTSNLGEFRDIGYNKGAEESTYNITLRATTGIYDFNSNYYYMK